MFDYNTYTKPFMDLSHKIFKLLLITFLINCMNKDFITNRYQL